MITEVLDRNVVAIPDGLAALHGIKPGNRLDWTESDRPDVLTVKILPDYAAIASSLMGAGRAHLKSGGDPIGDLLQERFESVLCSETFKYRKRDCQEWDKGENRGVSKRSSPKRSLVK